MENNSYLYNLEDEGNIIKLKWNAKLNSCDNMFSGMKNITEIDISNFDTSEVTSMYLFFKECSKLKRINFKKDNNIIDISLVTNMENMFYGCKSLISIDLSYLNISLVNKISSIFDECISLKILNFSNLDM